MSSKKKERIGSSFEGFLKDEGTYEETSALAIKRTLAWQLESAMAKESLTKNEMAKRMHTSRSQLDRILDPMNDTVSLATLSRAAELVGRKLTLELT